MTITNQNIKIYCFLGLPGSGKGTQVEMLAKKLNAKVLSIGDEIRHELDGADFSDPFFRKMKENYEHGIPQSDSVVADIIKKRLKGNLHNIIFDNFPFSHEQADLFFKICHELNINKPELIIINISSDLAVKRIVYRKVCSDCGHIMIDDGDPICEKCGGSMISRSDDNKDTVLERIKHYSPRIDEVKAYFLHNGKVIDIDGSGSVEDVAKLIDQAI